MGDAAVEGAAHDAAGFLEIVDVPEVVPEAEGNGGQQQAGIAASPVGHAAVVAGGIEHAGGCQVEGRLAKPKSVTRKAGKYGRSAGFSRHGGRAGYTRAG